MALKPLEPACKEPLSDGWAVVVMEAGRSNEGVQTTIALLQGTEIRDTRNKIILADPTVQETLATAYAAQTGCAKDAIVAGLRTLVGQVEGLLRQMAAEAKAARAQARAAAPTPLLPPPAPTEDPATSLGAVSPCTQGANALRIVREYKDRLIYTIGSGWLMWDGSVWRLDPTKDDALTTGFIADLPKVIAKEAEVLAGLVATATDKRQREEFAELASDRLAWAIHTDNASALSGALKMAKAHLLVPDIKLDADPWLLNCANGTLNLRTGALLPPDPAHFITRLAPVMFDDTATCPTWERFLTEVFADDMEMVAFLQRGIGWCLTGVVQERALFFLYGPQGYNGKTTIVEGVQEVLGTCAEGHVGYARKVDAGTFMKSKNFEDNQRRAVSLHGPRFVYSSEVGEGQHLNVQLIKDITGNDTLEARRLYREAFTFKPTFKTWMYGNHKPVIHDTDDAIWDRVKLVEFEQSFKDRVDIELPGKIKAEISGILNWALVGCKAWIAGGLLPPAKVQASTKAYREEQDVFAPFLAEKCLVRPGETSISVKASELYKTYKKWCDDNDSEVQKQVRFGNHLTSLGCPSDNNKTGRGARRLGIGLLVSPDNTPDSDKVSATPGVAFATPLQPKGSSASVNNSAVNSNSATPATPETEKSRGKEISTQKGDSEGSRGSTMEKNGVIASDETATPSPARGSICYPWGSTVGDTQPAFTNFRVSNPWCLTCKQNVSYRVLLLLDGGEQYFCETCDTWMGAKAAPSPTPVADTLDLEGVNIDDIPF
jgi:P4 family phage/plasmid primase-like protien